LNFEVIAIVRFVRPWYAPSKTTTPCRFVADRAMCTERFERLGSAVHEHGAFREVSRRERVQPLGQGDRRLVGRDDPAHVNELFGLIADRLDHAVRRVANRQRSDASREVDEAVAIHVGDERPVGRRDPDRREFRRAGRHRRLPARDEGAAFRARNVGLEADEGVGHGASSNTDVIARRSGDTKPAGQW
jgi:hypothetical protein